MAGIEKRGAPMHCVQCGKLIQKALYLNKCNKRLSTSFCCDEHYLKWWRGNPLFIPLPEWTKKGK